MELSDWRIWWKHFGFPELRHLLLVWWDPVGVYGEPAAIDEYDDYVRQVGRMLRSGADEDEIAGYLNGVSSEEMELDTPDLGRQAAAKVVDWHRQAVATQAQGS